MTASKLPEWPEHIAGPTTDAIAALSHQTRLASAALARMEALVEVVTLWRKRMRHSMDDDDLQAVDELLAACERRN